MDIVLWEFVFILSSFFHFLMLSSISLLRLLTVNWIMLKTASTRRRFYFQLVILFIFHLHTHQTTHSAELFCGASTFLCCADMWTCHSHCLSLELFYLPSRRCISLTLTMLSTITDNNNNSQQHSTHSSWHSRKKIRAERKWQERGGTTETNNVQCWKLQSASCGSFDDEWQPIMSWRSNKLSK